MLRLRAVLAALLLGAPLAANAADITRIASSLDEDDPFDLFLDVSFARTQSRSKIVREQLEPGTTTISEHTEIWHSAVDSRLNIDLAIGLYQDLQFSFSLPLILQQNDSYGFISGTDTTNSTIVLNCVNPDGSFRTNCTPSNPANSASLFTVPSTHRRGGLGNMRFGLAYAFFNEEKDPTKPMWVVGIDYEAPTAKMRDPSLDNTVEDNRGNVGDRVHKYTFYTAFSRRMGVADPYFRVHYTLPVAGPGIYSNCFNRAEVAGEGFTSPTLGTPENCFTGRWNRKETGIKYPHQGGFMFGSEFTAFNDRTKGQKFSLDLRGIGNYVSSGRYYNELSAALRKLLATQDYFQVGGQLGATAIAGNSFRLRAAGTFLYTTDHALTGEDLVVQPDAIDERPGDVNPNYDFRIDLPSRRFRASEGKTFRLDLQATFMF
ncbi:hypothetical protein [Hyalangium rubrum]|uniref:Porin n=1 Tax=Hyalangium rubrum TaxID=3103134 RepID=A0ABU5HEN2_9BACT|nr:hypothetical protein [Hyalangium sp. s54d21]MDY7231579.1 hypothetical protein [Hyalangium sp. s54d21]